MLPSNAYQTISTVSCLPITGLSTAQCDGTTFTMVGTVGGTFDAVAISAAGTEKDFSFIWTGPQTEAGKDKPADDLSAIQLTLATPNPSGLDLPSDILSGTNTEHAEIYPVFAGTGIDLTGAVKINGIKQQMEAIEDQFGTRRQLDCRGRQGLRLHCHDGPARGHDAPGRPHQGGGHRCR